VQGRVRWFLVFWMFILSSVAFLDRVNISIAGSAIAADYRLSNIQLGWIFSAFLMGYALLQTPGGWLVDRLGPRRVLAGGVLWWGVFTALTAALSPTIAGALGLLISIRFLLGAGEAVMFPASNQFVARWIPRQERGIANGVIFAGVGVGAGISPPLVTYIMVHYGWRWSFWVSAVIGGIAGLVWFVAARDTPEEHSAVSAHELAVIQAGRHSERSTSAAKGGEPQRDASRAEELVSWGRILVSKDVWAITLSYFCYGYVAWIFFSWFYIYLAKVRGLDLKASAIYATLPFLAMAVCCPLGGAVSDRLTRWRGKRLGRCGVAAVALGMASGFLVFGSRVDSARLASVVLAGGAGALYLAQSSYWSITADMSGGSSGSVSGFMNMGAQLAGAVSASLTPAIAAHYGWTASFFFGAGLCALGALSWLFVDPERNLASPAK
jgi:ACS family glucarate transporter-like MFS transporter